MIDWVIVGAGAVVFVTLVIVQAIMRSKRPVRSAIAAMIFGVLALLAVNFCSQLTNVSIPLSPLTISISMILGISGVICLLLLQRIL